MKSLRRSFRIFLLMTIAIISLEAQDGGDASPFRFLPSRHMVHDFVADGTAHRFSAVLLSSNDVQVGVGGILPMIDYDPWGIPVQASIGASIHTRLDPGQSIAVQSAEFSVDFFLLDAQVSNDLIVRTGMTHSSHHLGDGLNGDSTKLPIDYSRDDAQLYVIHSLPLLGGQAYAGVRYAYDLIIRQPNQRRLAFHAGMHMLLWSFSQDLSLFAGGDIKIRQELSYGTSQRYEAGLQYRSETGRVIRLTISYSGGFDERGQFLGKPRSEAGAGIVIVL
jgi:hypothetical protein